MTLFESTIRNLELEDAYNSAREYYNNHETITRILSTLGVAGLVDRGDVLDSSFSNPKNFLKVTDSLIDYLNDNLDSLPNAAEIIANVMEIEAISADCFVPDLNVSPNANPSSVDVTLKGVALALSFFGAVPIDTDEPDDSSGIPTDMADGVLLATSTFNFLGRLLIYENSSILWSATEAAESRITTSREIEVEIPGTVNVEQVLSPDEV